MSHTTLRPNFPFSEERLASLRAAVPEAFADGQVDWSILREAVGDELGQEAEPSEHFGLFWPGKRDARRQAAMPTRRTIVPTIGAGIDEATTSNLFIEGNNLEVLKVLLKSYAGRVKMIYIDPPYNTGNDFVYNDDYTDTLGEYLRKTAQSDAKGALTTNTRADGRFHSNWLSMMYPRLRLARSFLRDDGLIFVSIDDGEVDNLRLVMNEIFGEECFVEQIVWKNKYGSGALTKGFANVHEYVLCYSRAPFTSLAAPLSEEQVAGYKLRDEKFAIRGGYVTQPLATTSKDERRNLRYPILWKGEEIWPEKQWIWSKDRVDRAIANNELVVSETETGYSVRVKQYLRDENGVQRKGKPVSILNGPFNQEGTAEITELLGKGVYDFPKPSALLKYFFSFVINDTDDRAGIFMDFFAGSGTAGHAVLALNREDGGTRRFLAVQLAEPTPVDSVARKAGFSVISQITQERIRRVIKKLKKEAKAKANEDLGFRSFKLVDSHYKAWQEFSGGDVKQLETLFDQSEDPLVKGWTVDGLTTEIILIEGFPLDSRVSGLASGTANVIRSVTSDQCTHRLLVCLDKQIADDIESNVTFEEHDVFVCLDSALSDQAKQRLSDRCTLKTI